MDFMDTTDQFLISMYSSDLKKHCKKFLRPNTGWNYRCILIIQVPTIAIDNFFLRIISRFAAFEIIRNGNIIWIYYTTRYTAYEYYKTTVDRNDVNKCLHSGRVKVKPTLSETWWLSSSVLLLITLNSCSRQRINNYISSVR